MHKHSHHEAFGKEQARTYDERNTHLLPINAGLHYLTSVILGDLSPNAQVLVVGSGTGSEIIALAKAFPEFSFTAVEPSDAMLEVCRDRLTESGVLERCKLVHGFVHDVSHGPHYDAAICFLVLHHTKEKERESIITGIFNRLKPSRYFVAAELSYDFSQARPGDVMEKWKLLLSRTDAPKEKIETLPAMMKEHLSIQTPAEFESMLLAAGFSQPVQFFQSLLIRAWYSQKAAL